MRDGPEKPFDRTHSTNLDPRVRERELGGLASDPSHGTAVELSDEVGDIPRNDVDEAGLLRLGLGIGNALRDGCLRLLGVAASLAREAADERPGVLLRF